jgi:caffeoyl-CoA O-methyltransferase
MPFLGEFLVIVDPEIEKYMKNLLPARDAVLAEMEASAAARRIPIVGPAVGAFLSLMVQTSGAKRIFELGSAIGYSTIWLARAAGPGAEIHYSDGDSENAAEARNYFERSGVSESITIHVADAIQALRQTPGTFDLIFNDVDKEGYPAVLDAVTERLKPGGLFITDNALWHSRVLQPSDAAARAVVDFNAKLFIHQSFTASIVPLRDGLAVARKVA